MHSSLGRSVLWAALVAWLALTSHICSAQDPQNSSNSSPAQGVSGLKLEGVTLAPFSRPRFQKPLVVQAIVSNATSQTRSAIVLAKIDAAPDFQGTVQVQVPPNSQRVVEARLRVPPSLPTKNILELSVSLRDEKNIDQVLLGAAGTPLIDSLRVSISEDAVITALVMDKEPPVPPEWAWPQSYDQMPYEWAIATRVDTDNSRRTLTIDHQNLPSQLIDWEGLDVIAIGNDRPFQDPAVMSSMNRWLAAGGRVWVMLDLIDASNVRKILPEGQSCQMIDDIDLTRFVVDTKVLTPLAEADRTVTSDQPIRLRRIVQSGGEVSHVVDGFPAATWYRVGRGQLLVTTLGASGWVKPRQTRRRPEDDYNCNYEMHAWAQPLADRLHEFKQTRTPIELMDVQYPMQQIGNPVLDRGFVLSMVFGFCALLCVSGAICWWRGLMLQLGWLIPVISLVATVPLLVASARLRRDIPNTSAHLQLVEVQPGSDNIQATQWTATYMSGADQARLTGKGDALVAWPHSTDQLDLRRWNWQDYGQWELTSSGWPNGLWRLRSRYALPPRKLDVLARLDARGLSLTVPTELSESLADAVVQYWSGSPVPAGALEPGKEHLVGTAHLTLEDSWLGTTMVNDEQSRRDQVYKLLQARESELAFPSYPAVLGWTKLWPSSLQWNEPRDERGATLLVLPIQLLPVDSGTKVLVPHTVLRCETPTQDGNYSSSFSNFSGWWRKETTIAASVPLRFHLPSQINPLIASSIDCDLQLRAPQRTVTLKCRNGQGQWVEVKRMDSPLGAVQAKITDPQILETARQGWVDFELTIGQQGGESITDLGSRVATWQVDYFRIALEGEVAPR